ncbi:orotate phosphoribosyltransferase [Candidatus Bathyarchaeota archaeon]|mgnify:CR=1 FL=1|nr:MAG: orotate phosphoribosyltransferase [Candidatus Bathyarchaeota archaeon]RLI04977.1 MAG: orotate phosphoribosyltransferase [Candidatus Bathyarchaeota archaeon]RLI06589.1 MAG: orotate phosphoribosyltransferase [Candidatus Bathyarchaeota archaeon]
MSEKASIIADALIQSEALKFGEFKLKSGIVSPYYIDLSWLLSSPESFSRIVNLTAQEIKRLASEEEINKLASIELKGALLLPTIAYKLKMPCIIVRKESKSYGLRGRITGGTVKPGDRFLFFDDVVTSGGSKIEGIRPIEEAGGRIETILVVVDREQGGKEELKRRGYRLESLITISQVIHSLLKAEKIHPSQAEEILQYVKRQRKGF